MMQSRVSSASCFLLFIASLGGCALAQTLSPALLVIAKDDHLVSIVDPSSLKVVGQVPVGTDPHEITVSSDGKTAYVSNYGAFSTPQHTLTVIDLVAQKPQSTVDLGALLAPHGLATSNGKIYFTAEGSKAIGRYNPAAGNVDWVLGLGQNRTHMLVVASDENRIFATDVNSDSITVLDRDKNADVSGWKQTVIPVGKGPEGFDVSPDGKEVWTANSHDGTVSVIDVAARRVVQTIDVHTKRSNRLKFTPDGKRVLISDLDSGDLVVLDAHSRKEIKRINLGHGAAGVLIAPDGSRAFIAVSRDNYVAVVDLNTVSITGKIETGRGPDGMAWAAAK